MRRARSAVTVAVAVLAAAAAPASAATFGTARAVSPAGPTANLWDVALASTGRIGVVFRATGGGHVSLLARLGRSDGSLAAARRVPGFSAFATPTMRAGHDGTISLCGDTACAVAPPGRSFVRARGVTGWPGRIIDSGVDDRGRVVVAVAVPGAVALRTLDREGRRTTVARLPFPDGVQAGTVALRPDGGALLVVTTRPELSSATSVVAQRIGPDGEVGPPVRVAGPLEISDLVSVVPGATTGVAFAAAAAAAGVAVDAAGAPGPAIDLPGVGGPPSARIVFPAVGPPAAVVGSARDRPRRLVALVPGTSASTLLSSRALGYTASLEPLGDEVLATWYEERDSTDRPVARPTDLARVAVRDAAGRWSAARTLGRRSSRPQIAVAGDRAAIVFPVGDRLRLVRVRR